MPDAVPSSLTHKGWFDPKLLGALIGAALALGVFFAIAAGVKDGATPAIDQAITTALHPDSLSDGFFGSRWMREAARDVTSLGGGVVLTLLVLVTSVFLLLARRAGTALFVIAATSLGAITNTLLKGHFDRARPDLIPHDLWVTTASFPSGHAMSSATVYLTLAVVLARLTPRLRLQIFVIGIAVLLTGLVGLTRVYLGVHWPSDVAAGWALGAAWALGAWSAAQAIHIGRAVRLH